MHMHMHIAAQMGSPILPFYHKKCSTNSQNCFRQIVYLFAIFFTSDGLKRHKLSLESQSRL